MVTSSTKPSDNWGPQSLPSSSGTAGGGWIYHLYSGTLELEAESSGSGTSTGDQGRLAKRTLVRGIGDNSVDGFGALHRAVNQMSRLPAGEEYAIDADTAEGAEDLITILSQHNVPAPKVFSHGGDAVVLVWDRPTNVRYLTIVGREASLLVVDKLTKDKQEGDLPNALGDRLRWLEGFTGSQKSSTSVDVD